ncbi:hydantoinase/oxoprolinase family protein [Roseomonas sp. 18066]|uniref:hydantoinase/oxoprolinase family protein n=1 Tax=Roseomonas sp. 18066 TaxID=2681412 RepID=UPI00135BACC9|nr:hydantoinase/oxoprolinase family protein [Roseomonas sp. 18066]
MGIRVGVDIGGSFTDFAVLDEADGSVRALKVFSRPDQPGQEVMEGLRQLEARHGIPPSAISYFTHGTTVGVNAVIQRRGLRLGLITTEGFVDVLELARLKIADMYDLFSRRPDPLVPRERVFGIGGRIGPDGAELRAVDRASVLAALQRAQATGCEALVVSLLHSYRNPAHEQAVKAILAEAAPELPVFLSCETWPIIREYERTVTAVVGGYVQPRVAHYLTSLQQALKNAGVAPEPRITKSNGGVMAAEQGKADCIQMILSGTASGVIGAAFVARSAGLKKALSLDIGGTSADVALIIDGQPQYGVGETIGEFQIYIPSVSVSSIGEGGGSVAWVDSLGVLKVGPESAGSSPGPVCYGRGGQKPTVTDSFVACGLIGASELGYNAVRVDIVAARAAFATLAQKLGADIEPVAEAVQQICVSGMYTGISALVSRFGIDPREFTLIAFGGAGPMLAPMLARSLGMAEVLVPPTPGVLSALGGLVADLKNDFIRTIYSDLDAATVPVLQETLVALQAQGRAWLEGEGAAGDTLVTADMRYQGQSFEIEVPLQAAWIAAGNLAALREAFHDRHAALFGHADRKAAVQLINLRLVAQGDTPKPVLPRLPAADGEAVPSASIEAWLDGAMRRVPLHHRRDLRAGHAFPGPAVIAQDDCTTVVPPGCTVRVDELGNLRITVGERAA